MPSATLQYVITDPHLPAASLEAGRRAMLNLRRLALPAGPSQTEARENPAVVSYSRASMEDGRKPEFQDSVSLQ